jgi:diguanylate cyclase (GGDEF)-like protein/PAS domain S-box-containing protein
MSDAVPRQPRPDQAAELADLLAAQQRAELAIQQAERAEGRLRAALEILPQGIVFLDAEGRYILWNKKYEELYSGTADLFRTGERLEDTLRVGVTRGNYPEAVGREEAWIAERMLHLSSASGRHEQRTSEGRHLLIEERRTPEGDIIGLRVDVTEMKQREESFRLLFQANPVPMFVHHLETDAILAANEAAVAHYGYAETSLLKMRLGDLRTDAPSHAVRRYSADLQGAPEHHCKASGEPITVCIYARALTYDGQPAALVSVVDVTERERVESRIAHMAHHDALTDLPNRVLFRERIEYELRRRAGTGLTAVFCLDLDNFKAVNDALGHPTGDKLLQQVSQRLLNEVCKGDTVARLGGDEFAVLRPDMPDAATAAALATRLIQAIGAPYEIDDHTVSVGLSIGIALGPPDGATCEALVKSADLALYRAKTDGRGTFCFFEPEMDARLQRRRRLELDLRAALAAEAIEVHYQPLLNLRTGAISGFEALVRWPHAEGDVSPGEFIPIAEESGLIYALGTYVLRRACRDASQWPADVKVAVNLSALQFRHGDLVATVQSALAAAGISPQRLDLEITEALVLDRSERVLNTLRTLRSMGIGISMDDFGTGYSSLSYLRSFPFDKIKIDRSFVTNLNENTDSQAIVRAILSLGNSLGIAITAEGVETELDLACLQAEGCLEAQGFLFAKAQPASAIAAMLLGEGEAPPRAGSAA